MSNRRSSQELSVIFFELRAPACLWGRYDPKTENFTLFYIYLLHIHSLSKTFYVNLKCYPRATFHVLVAKVYVVTGAHYVTKSKIPLFAKALPEIPITFLIINQISQDEILRKRPRKQIWVHFLVKVAALAYFHISSMLNPKMWVAKFSFDQKVLNFYF